MPLTYKKKNWRMSLAKGDRVRVRGTMAKGELEEDIVTEVPYEPTEGKWLVKLQATGVVALQRIASRRKPPKYKVGDTIFTKHPVYTSKKNPIKGYLALIRGTPWRVVEVCIPDIPSRARPQYRLKIDEFECWRAEGRLTTTKV